MHKGRVRGVATKGNKVSFGEFGLQALDFSRITGRQIEAARIAITRKVKGCKTFDQNFLINLFLKNLLKLEWVKVKEISIDMLLQ